jgi:hypothetical protein
MFEALQRTGRAHTGRDLAAEFERQRAAARVAATASPQRVLSGADIAALPPPLQRHLRASGAIGKPRPALVQMSFDAQMWRKPGQAAMPGVAQQFDRFDRPQRGFFMRSRMFGLPVAVWHHYEGTQASMTVRVASLFNVVDDRSDELARTETVTVLNDMVFFAPAWLADSRLAWRAVDDRRADVTFTNGPHRVSASLRFDEAGELVDFTSDDRSLLQDDGRMARQRWSTPMRALRVFDGLRVPTEGEAVWHQPQGDFVYGRFKLTAYEAR